MRLEIEPLIENAKKLVLRLEEIIFEESKIKREEYFEKQSEYWGKMAQCLRNCAEVKNIYPGSPSSMFISWDENEHHNVVVEISAFAPIVAIYFYGTPPLSLLTTLDHCLIDLDLTKLTNEEVVQLEQEHWYHSIF